MVRFIFILVLFCILIKAINCDIYISCDDFPTPSIGGYAWSSTKDLAQELLTITIFPWYYYSCTQLYISVYGAGASDGVGVGGIANDCDLDYTVIHPSYPAFAPTESTVTV